MEEKILLVEDEEKLARMVELELRYEGYQVDKSFDGRSGLERALSGGFDLVLLDIMLPQLSGMEVLRRLGRDIPVLDKSLCHIIASGMFNGIFEIVVHDMPRDQAMRDVDQLRDFYTAGWLKLMGG